MSEANTVPVYEPWLGWAHVQTFDKSVKLGSLSVEIDGIVAWHKDYGYVCGASSTFEKSPSKARFELIERVALVKHLFEEGIRSYKVRCPLNGSITNSASSDMVFPEAESADRKFVASNGVALHSTWEKACEAAAFELVERHVVLESFYGGSHPLLIDSASSVLESDAEADFEFSSYLVGEQETDVFSTPIYVCVTLMKPRNPSTHHQIIGFGSALTVDEARRKSESEAIQRFGFLDGTEIPLSAEFSADPMFHQTFHLVPSHHWQVLDWLKGKFFQAGKAKTKAKTIRIQFADLTIPATQGYPLAKALSEDARKLVWGRQDQELTHGLPDILVHPIP